RLVRARHRALRSAHRALAVLWTTARGAADQADPGAAHAAHLSTGRGRGSERAVHGSAAQRSAIAAHRHRDPETPWGLRQRAAARSAAVATRVTVRRPAPRAGAARRGLLRDARGPVGERAGAG